MEHFCHIRHLGHIQLRYVHTRTVLQAREEPAGICRQLDWVADNDVPYFLLVTIPRATVGTPEPFPLANYFSMRVISISATLERQKTIGVQHAIHRRQLLPLGIQRDIGLDLRIEVKSSLAPLVRVPALERMARLGRVCRLGHLAARLDRLGFDGRPTIGVERNRALSNGGHLNLARKNVSHENGEYLRRLCTRCSALRLKAKLSISIVHAAHDARGSSPLQGFDGE